MICLKKLINGYKYMRVSNASSTLANHLTKSLSTDENKYNKERDENNYKGLDLPPLMKLEPKGMPNIFHSLKYQFIVNFYLRPYIDKEFSTKNFLNGAKQALSVISSHLANDNIQQLQGLVTDEALEEISINYSALTPSQKQQLRVLTEDILLCYAYSIQLKKESPNKTVVKILVVYDCLRNMQELIREEIDQATRGNFVMPSFQKYLDRKYLCNYEFVREYVKGVQSDWIVSKLLHIKDKDVLKKYGFFKK